MTKRLAAVGGGPSALFLLRRLIDQKLAQFQLHIFEEQATLGAGFPYSPAGASPEHVTNVSGNEIPDLPDSLTDWINANPGKIASWPDLDKKNLSDYHVVPRLLMGTYLDAQFRQYLAKAAELGLSVVVHLETGVEQLSGEPRDSQITLVTRSGSVETFDAVVLCTGHRWPVVREGRVKNHFDSPYPPSKLVKLKNLPIQVKGSSLTAIDAVRTVSRANGAFSRDDQGKLIYHSEPGAPEFSITMYSRHALLPGLRFHLEDPHLSRKALLSREHLEHHRAGNDGFISLDYLFDNNFKKQFKKDDPDFYERIKDWTMEEFVAAGLSSFASADPFEVFAAEYSDSLASIRNKKSEYWKEKLAILSVAMNHPAKYLSAEDSVRFHEHLMPLISVVIAFVPQNSAEEFLALHAAGKLLLDKAPHDFRPDETKPFIDCTGQPHLGLKDFPFPDLVKSGCVSQAKVSYQSRKEELEVAGLAITDNFRAITTGGQPHPGLFIMAVPYIGGFNPDYSGLDFCEDAAKAIVEDLKTMAGERQ